MVKVLVVSRSYPNSAMPVFGVWVERLVRSSTQFCEPKVIAPVPYCPPLPGLGEYYRRFRRIGRREELHGIEVFHPRFVVGPGFSLHSFEWLTYYLGVRREVDRLRHRFPFDLIHAHYTYPDGVVAAHLGQRYHVPVIITEQVPWRPWMDNYPLVRRQAVWAARRSVFHIAVSRAVRQSIVHFAGESPRLRIIPDGVDGTIFTLPENPQPPVMDQLLFVGAVRPVKGVDILLKAVRVLVDRRRDVRLLVVGDTYYRSYRQEQIRLQRLARELGLGGRVRFTGKQPESELVRTMQESALLVLPSRLESFGMVLVEALACGTPVVATRCGGPEDIVNDQVGVLVPPEDSEGLARGIEHVLDHREQYDPVRLRSYALERFGLPTVSQQVHALYVEALERFRRAQTLPGD